MAGFQTEVRQAQTSGIPGEFAENSPRSVFTATLDSNDASANVFSRAFSNVNNEDRRVQAGGTGAFAGFMTSPKQFVRQGELGNAFAANLTMPNEVPTEIAEEGIIYATLQNAGNIGDEIHYDTTTGATAGQLYCVAPGTSPAADRADSGARLIRQNIPAAGTGIIRIGAN